MNPLRKVVQARRLTLNAIKDRILYLNLARLHGKNHGLTWHLVLGNVFEAPTVHASKFVGIVSVHPVRGETLSHMPTASDFKRFVKKNALLISVPSEWRCIGSWHDKESGKHHLDISQVCFTYDQAAILGRRYNQKSIYLIKKGKSIRIK